MEVYGGRLNYTLDPFAVGSWLGYLAVDPEMDGGAGGCIAPKEIDDAASNKKQWITYSYMIMYDPYHFVSYPILVPGDELWPMSLVMDVLARSNRHLQFVQLQVQRQFLWQSWQMHIWTCEQRLLI